MIDVGNSYITTATVIYDVRRVIYLAHTATTGVAMPKVTGKDQATREQLLADALRRVLVRDGVLGASADLSGPELLAAAEHYLDASGRGVYDDDIPF